MKGKLTKSPAKPGFSVLTACRLPLRHGDAQEACCVLRGAYQSVMSSYIAPLNR